MNKQFHRDTEQFHRDTAIARSYFFRTADVSTLMFLLFMELISWGFFSHHLSIWAAIFYLAFSAFMNHITLKYRVKLEIKKQRSE